MKVPRLSTNSLYKLLAGEVIEPAICLIKIYSNGCNYCHNLKEYYEDLAEKYEDIYFYAFNIGDDLELEKRLGFRGVPTIIKLNINLPQTQIKILHEPATPNQLTWYQSSDIINFIEQKGDNQ